MARSHAAARPTLLFRCQSQPRPEPRDQPPCWASRDLHCGSTLSDSTSTTCAWLRLPVRPTCTAGEDGQGRRGRRLYFAVLTESGAVEAFGESVCVLCLLLFQRSLVTLGAASKTNCSIRRVNHGSCFGYIGSTFDIWRILPDSVSRGFTHVPK